LLTVLLISCFSKEEIFQLVGKGITLGCLAGFNGTIFAYGQTGSGKTFTITGLFVLHLV